jgi:alkylhydroperoxidase family enzyme
MNSIDPVWRIARELAVQQPEAAELLAVANAHAWSAVSPILLELARLRIAMLIGNQAGLLRRSNAAREAGVSESKIALISSYPSSREFSRIERDCLEFTELFVIDVSSLTEDNLTVLRSHFAAEQLPIFVMALYVTECTQRLEMVAPRLLDALPHVGVLHERGNLHELDAGAYAVEIRYAFHKLIGEKVLAAPAESQT